MVLASRSLAARGRTWRCLGVVGSAVILGGCGDVLGIEPWDVAPGTGGGPVTTTASSAGGDGPASTGTSGGEAPGTGGAGGGGAGGGSPTTVATSGGGGQGGCGVPDTSEHCGACDRSCWGGACIGGTTCAPALLHPQPAGLDLLAVTGDHVVWVDGNGELRRVRKSSPNPMPDDSSLGGIGAVTSLAAGMFDGQHAAFHARAGRITRRLLDQADPSPLVLLDDPAFQPEGLVPSGGYVYWFDWTSPDPGVYRSGWTEAGTPPRYCSGSYVRDLAVIGSAAFYVNQFTSGSPPRKMFSCNGTPGGDFLANVPGHIPLEVEADAGSGYVFYTTIANADAGVESALWRKASAAAAPERVVAPTAFSLSRFTHGGPYLYGRTSAGELVATIKEPDGPIDVLAADLVQAVAADDEGVYWSNQLGVWALRRD